jgi:hypothetical protein
VQKAHDAGMDIIIKEGMGMAHAFFEMPPSRSLLTIWNVT